MDYQTVLSDLRHDIKNHLSAIKGFSQLIESESKKINSDDLASYAKKIDTRVNQITEILDQTRNFK